MRQFNFAERIAFQLRFGTLNTMNRSQFNSANPSPYSSNFRARGIADHCDQPHRTARGPYPVLISPVAPNRLGCRSARASIARRSWSRCRLHWSHRRRNSEESVFGSNLGL